MARIPGAGAVTPMPVLTGPVTLGHLELAAGSSLSSHGPSAIVVFDQPGDGTASIVASGDGVDDMVVSAPISIISGETLSIDVADSHQIKLDGAITSSVGDIVKSGTGRLDLLQDSPAWGGAMSVVGGVVRSYAPTTLGSADGATILQSGAVLEQIFPMPTDENYVVDDG
ncbi:MAG: hypothetical protein CMJ58_27545 [Planctomycetaceae bacterium]|nr:hypothetical protein [Planctomycetaceae bacterium]